MATRRASRRGRRRAVGARRCPPPATSPAVVDLAHAHGALAIFDEVITGFRLAPGGARALRRVPDLSCYGKALGNGMPISAVAGSWDVMRAFEEVFFSGTHGGETLSLAAARVVLDTVADGAVLAGIETMGQRLLDAFVAAVAAQRVGDRVTVGGEPHRTVVGFPGADGLLVRSWVQQTFAQAGILFNGSMFICARHTDRRRRPRDRGVRPSPRRHRVGRRPAGPPRRRAGTTGLPAAVSPPPRVLVAGAGSIGRRHAANIQAAGARVTVLDPDRGAIERIEGVETIHGDSIPSGFDGVVIASPTVHHAAQTVAALDTGARVLVEKPLACSCAEVPEVALGDRVCVGYNLRFVAPLARLVDAVHGGEIGEIRSARVWFGSWLPGWRAHDYRDTYSAQRALGGGVLLDAIHELDEVVWLFGDDRFEIAGALVQQLGDLELDVEDSVRALLVHESGAPVEIALDYLSRAYRRGIEVVGSTATVRYDWASERFEHEGPDGRTRDSIAPDVDRAYADEARAFVAWIAGGPPLPVSGAGAMASLGIADRIRERAA